jgi:serine/threonine protein kinase
MLSQPDITLAGKPPSVPARIARALASPVGVLIAMPLIVVGAGLAILLVGRDTTRAASESLVRKQLHDQALQVEHEVGFALDQARPLLESLRGIADQDRPIYQVGHQLYDLVVGRPGVAWVSISYPDGTFQAARRMGPDDYEVHESRISDGKGTVKKFRIEHGSLVQFAEEESTYDPRQRDFYQAAVQEKGRVWTRPYTFFKTHETGITCVEPGYTGDKSLRMVLTVDFDVGALSEFVGKAPVEGSRTMVFADDGSILSYPFAADQLKNMEVREGLPLHAQDLEDPAVMALFAALRARPPVTAFTYLDLDSDAGAYLASVMPIGGKRGDAATPLAWYVATVVPEATLLGPTRALVTRSVVVSAIALAVAVAIAMMLAWNLVRMRRAVATARGRAAEAESRARELGSWRLVEKLGQGGMGEVWRAEHRLLVRQAAIKLMRADPKASPREAAETRERFRREAQALAAMRSRHTIEIFDYGVTEDHAFYYVMELLDGIDLDTLGFDHGPQPAARVMHIMQQACSSLAEAHDAGLLHRDVKPANIFISRAADEVDVVKLLDFGIVHVVGTSVTATLTAVADLDAGMSDPRMTAFGTVLGTPGFMAPEQIRGQEIDGRADLYALGCVAWLLLTGSEVFERTSQQALMFNHIVEPVPALARRVPGWVPAGMVEAIIACLQKDPHQRPPNARVLASILRAIPIPDEHAWTATKAQEWWRTYVPLPVAELPAGSQARLLIPAPTDPPHAPSPSSSADAATIRGAGSMKRPQP